MKILFVTHHWENNTHHARYSGYQRVVHYLAKKYNVSVLTWGRCDDHFQDGSINTIVKKTSEKDFLFQRRRKLSKYASKIAHDYDIIHLLYSDCGYQISIKRPIVTTFHILPSVAKRIQIKERLFLILKYILIQKRVLKKSNKLIVVSRNLYDCLKDYYSYKLYYIPHGVDTHFWKPGQIDNKMRNSLLKNKYKAIILSVGSHGVNTKQLEQAISKMDSCLFILVGLDLNKEYPNVLVYASITDDELKKLYQISDVFFRPVHFATANNSILEAMAMGKIIVTDKIDGITDYLSEKNGYLAKSVEEYIPMLKSAVNSKESSRRGQRANLAACKKFDWDVIAQRFDLLYSEILKEFGCRS